MQARTSLALCILAMGLLALSGCSSKTDKSAQKAADWLKGTAAVRKLPASWTVNKITPLGSDGVEMEIKVGALDQVNIIRAMPQMQRFAAIQAACPPENSEIWAILIEDQKLWLNVVGPDDKRLTRGNCWHQ